ncbi:DNA utilization protein GntX [uncultured Roseburia sp.]|uniref:ComF family protein n=1 Tax=Brotonthovivens ammoniilytica TaxID=2981725 RepID=A0ABT2TM28_9FIRM|nr:ComF family protein [Brotonthovivens ammoniilytica]MCU6762692.1 ComF family protein [Brotonthovivens ammoniilytica]SCI84985.1 DNA utilization protein GntX [uncultured Roseburia sp.]
MKQIKLYCLADHALQLLYPYRCPVCDQIPDSKKISEYICPECKKKLIYIAGSYCMKCGKPLVSQEEEYCSDCIRRRHEFDAGRSLFSYQGEVRSSLYRFKYGNKRSYAFFYGSEICKQLETWIRRCGIDYLIPIPLYKKKKRKRGYNQAEVLARVLSRNLSVPVLSSGLVRVKNTSPQKELSAAERRKNLAGAFACFSESVRGKTILLTDDIYTTGATADAAAKVLKAAGARRVYMVSIAIGG